ncbi:MAG TPA: VCBS repeat-containing protein, partial [Candidatus Didemnitutus sp.]|nr:VCBS repeat-containing protein [Candidatus Didemnitutus sp.]
MRPHIGMRSRWLPTSTTLLTLFIACVLSVVQLHGQNREGELGQYNGQKDAVHLQRYLLPEGTRVDTVVIGLSGDVADTAGLLEIYGHSEGRVAPLRKAEPLLSILVSKTTLGYEKISIPITYEHPGGQLFIGFRQIASRVTLVTDMQPRTFSCFDAGVPWNDQVRIDADGSRKVLPFGFDVRIATTPKQLTSKLRYQRDTTIEGADPRESGSAVSNIVVADATNDNVADILCFGVVQQWNGSDWTGTIVDASARALHGMVADLDGDGHGEVVLVSEGRGHNSVIAYQYRSPIRESSAKSRGRDASFQNVGASPFSNDVPIAAHVVLDINNDGREEILLFTSASCSLVRRGLKGIEITAVPLPKLDEQIVAATAIPRGTSASQEVVVRLSRGSTIVLTSSEAMPSVSRTSPGNKSDSSVYRSVAFRTHVADERAGSTPELLMATRSDDEHNNIKHAEPRSEETLSSLLETDLDMDGRPELLSMSTGECRFISAWFGGDGVW